MCFMKSGRLFPEGSVTGAITSPFTSPCTFLSSAGAGVAPLFYQYHLLQSIFDSMIFCTLLLVPIGTLELSRISLLVTNMPNNCFPRLRLTTPHP